MQACRARSSGQLAWAVTVLGKPGSSPAQPGVETKHHEWGGGPQEPCPSRPGGWSEICGPWPAQRVPLRSAYTLRALPPAFVSSQMLWLQVTETTTGYHNRTFLGGYGGLTEQRELLRSQTAEKMVPRSRNKRALSQGRPAPTD